MLQIVESKTQITCFIEIVNLHLKIFLDDQNIQSPNFGNILRKCPFSSIFIFIHSTQMDNPLGPRKIGLLKIEEKTFLIENRNAQGPPLTQTLKSTSYIMHIGNLVPAPLLVKC